MKTITKLLVFAFSILTFNSFSQKRIAKEINLSKEQNISFKKFDNTLFKTQARPTNKVPLKTAVFFEYSSFLAKKSKVNDLDFITIPIQNLEGKTWLLDLKKIEKKPFTVSTKDGSFEYINDKKVSYSGVVRGHEKESLVSMIFYENEVKGFIKLNNEKVFEIGKMRDNNQHILYDTAETLSKHTSNFNCGFDDSNADSYYLDPSKIEKLKTTSKTFEQRKCVGLQAVVDYSIYSARGESNLQQTVDYIEDFYTQVFTIFRNHEIKIDLEDIFVHTVRVSDYGSPLTFVQTDTRYERKGDIIQFSRNWARGREGASHQGAVCRGIGYSWSRVAGDVYQYPEYTYYVGTAAHEIGHSLGSPHNFSCAWNNNPNYKDGDNNPQGSDKISGCRPTNDTNCPDFNGTQISSIMGYCRNKFVPLYIAAQEGDLMRMTIDSCPNDIEADCEAINLSTNSVSFDDKYILYSNPISSILKIKGIETTDKVSVVDLTGRTLLKFTGKGEIDISKISSGTYIVEINSNGKIFTKKILKK